MSDTDAALAVRRTVKSRFRASWGSFDASLKRQRPITQNITVAMTGCSMQAGASDRFERRMQMDRVALHRKWLSRRMFNWFRKRLPSMSDTERELLEAGDVWWNAELFTGNPDRSKLLDTPPPALSKEEKEFLEGPTERLCGMLDGWCIIIFAENPR